MVLDDVFEIARIEKICFPQDPWNVHALKVSVTNPYGYCLTAQIENKIVGYLIGTEGDGAGHLMNLAVSPQYRRKGIGSALLGNWIDRGRRLVWNKSTLEVRQSNFEAIKLYEKFGYKYLKTNNHYYLNGEDGIVMIRAFECAVQE